MVLICVVVHTHIYRVQNNVDGNNNCHAKCILHSTFKKLALMDAAEHK